MIRILFSTNKAFFSRAIRAFTWSAWSHCDIAVGNDLIGAVPGKGVVRYPIADRLASASRHQWYELAAPQAVIDAAESQLGKPYDWWGVLGIGLHRRWQEDDAWFCSELIAWAAMKAGTPLLRTDHWRITPRDLALSPLLREIGG